MLISIALVLSILAGQLIKFPLFGIQGPTILDFLIFSMCLTGTLKLKLKIRTPPLHIKLGLFFTLIAALSLIFTPLHLKPSEYLTSFSYTVRFFLYIFFGWIIYSGGFPKIKQHITKSLLISGVGLVILGLFQLIFFPNLEFLQKFGWDPHYFRTVSTFLDPNFAGAYFCLTLLLLVDKKITKLTVLLFVITYLALLTTFSRSSYLMFLTSGLAYSFLRKSRKIGIFIVVLFLVLILGFQIYSQLVAKPRGISREESASARLATWQQGFILFEKSPLIGIGFNSYKYAINEYNLADKTFLNSRGATTNDSSFLYILATTGILGFITYFLFLVSIIKPNLKNSFVLVAGVAGLIPHSFFANSLFYPFILIWILLISAIPKK